MATGAKDPSNVPPTLASRPVKRRALVNWLPTASSMYANTFRDGSRRKSVRRLGRLIWGLTSNCGRGKSLWTLQAPGVGQTNPMAMVSVTLDSTLIAKEANFSLPLSSNPTPTGNWPPTNTDNGPVMGMG